MPDFFTHELCCNFTERWYFCIHSLFLFVHTTHKFFGIFNAIMHVLRKLSIIVFIDILALQKWCAWRTKEIIIIGIVILFRTIEMIVAEANITVCGDKFGIVCLLTFRAFWQVSNEAVRWMLERKMMMWEREVYSSSVELVICLRYPGWHCRWKMKSWHSSRHQSFEAWVVRLTWIHCHRQLSRNKGSCYLEMVEFHPSHLSHPEASQSTPSHSHFCSRYKHRPVHVMLQVHAKEGLGCHSLHCNHTWSWVFFKSPYAEIKN